VNRGKGREKKEKQEGERGTTQVSDLRQQKGRRRKTNVGVTLLVFERESRLYNGLFRCMTGEVSFFSSVPSNSFALELHQELKESQER
jgi:hypothetical protein